MMKKFLILLIITVILLSAPPCEPPDLSFDSVEESQSFFIWHANRTPLISAHRGGPYPGYPENCIETFEYVLSKIPATLEIDISMTRDSVLILMHDRTLERTSTGSGRISDTEYRELQDLFLEDNEGELTEYKIPSLEEALRWARGKTVLNLDVKRGVPFDKIVDLIHQTQTQASVIVIVYNVEDALRIRRLDPNLLLSVSIRNEEELHRVKNAGIPMNRITAFTGTRLQPRKLYRRLHDEQVFVNLGTLGNLDQKAKARGDHWYRRWERMGVDIFSTDRPLEVARMLYKMEGE
jgi:glycerophosphoryl diester phosphodiesterase